MNKFTYPHYQTTKAKVKFIPMPKNKNTTKGTSIFGAINSDIIWFSLAFSAVFAAILIYFQVVQPNILRAYASESKANSADMLLDIEQKYNQYIQETKQLIPAQNSTTEICNTSQYYNGFGETNIILNQLEAKFEPSPNFKNLQDIYVFSSTEIQEQNTVNYQDYKSALDYLKEEKDKLIEVLAFLDFRNSWIDACEQIQTNRTTFATQEACEIIIRPSKKYLQGSNTTGRDEIQQMIERCEETAAPNFFFTNQWIFEFLQDYNNLISIDLSTTNLDQKDKLLQNYEQTKLSFTNRTATIDRIVNNKTNLSNIWYVLDINLEDMSV